MTMFDLDLMSRWDEALDRLTETASDPSESEDGAADTSSASQGGTRHQTEAAA